MKITKLGHCCLLVEEQGVKILTDPGSFTVEVQARLKNIDILLVTHEHGDHLHADSVKKLVEENPGVKIVTNSSVGKILAELGLQFEVVADGQSATIKNIWIEGFGKEHAEIYEEYGLVENTGYFVNNRLFYPGDAYTNPGKKVEILALPIAGPWALLKSAITYAKEIHPQVCFPVHDGMLKSGGFFHAVAKQFIETAGTTFIPVDAGEVGEF